MQKPQPKCLKLSEIRLDHRLQSRVEIDQDVVAEYRDAIIAGDKLPPVSVMFDKVYYYLVDGFHRYDATTAANLGEINALVTEGHFQDALLASVGANSKHGLRRTNDDKRRAVQTILSVPAWAEWSDNQIAKACGVSHPFVAAVRYPEAAKRQQENRDRSADRKRADVESDSTSEDANQASQPAVGLQDSPAIPEQKAIARETAAELVARTDAGAAQPSSRVDAVEQSSQGDDDELIAELQSLQRRVSVLSAEIDSLTATDHGAEIHKLTQLLLNADDKIARFEERMKDLKDFGAKFDALRKLLNVKSNRDVVGAVRKLVEATQ